MEEDRFKRSLPLIIVFLASLGAYSYQTGNILWILSGSAATLVVFIISRLRGEED